MGLAISKVLALFDFSQQTRILMLGTQLRRTPVLLACVHTPRASDVHLTCCVPCVLAGLDAAGKTTACASANSNRQCPLSSQSRERRSA